MARVDDREWIAYYEQCIKEYRVELDRIEREKLPGYMHLQELIYKYTQVIAYHKHCLRGQYTKPAK